jgi:hypothetical protein
VSLDCTFQLFDFLKDLMHAHYIKSSSLTLVNHTGRRFFAFQDLLAKGADSPYADW